MPWYMQKVFGKRMIVNEDRRLTTNLLVRGWGVVFASDVLTATETPTTVTRCYPDLFLRIGMTTVYNILRNPDRLRLALSWYVVPGMFF
ncbi:hypothetical protein Forpi1262_v005499 [Fusarium oxysporum f. sp. raphani]|uniref:Uncharacterized protein n=1 Tax=Fusarium oxysporum f. sp. raphani TaxID=96318 RepID=A0A8J5UFL4_FUSOX|nr:hypothetical protein Forpi1262_v005499 [Fusarium oxysporum f. sp. raphani]